jgi:hypothetical protein
MCLQACWIVSIMTWRSGTVSAASRMPKTCRLRNSGRISIKGCYKREKDFVRWLRKIGTLEEPRRKGHLPGYPSITGFVDRAAKLRTERSPEGR